MSEPLVSVIVPSFNHGKYIGDTLRSIFAQSFRDFEVIVVDDCSSDDSVSVARTFQDGRLTIVQLENNAGGSAALNIGIRKARGEFIAICNSDDAWVPSKLAQQVEVLRRFANVAAVFSDVKWIDDDGREMFNSPFGEVFSEPNRQRSHWMRRLVEQGNCLCHPSVLIRANIYAEIGGYNEWLRQLPDLDMWLRLICHSDIYISPEKLVEFRWHGGNTSTPTVEVSRRSANEHLLVLREFFCNAPPMLLKHAFGFFGDEEGAKGWSEIDKAHYLLTASGPYGSWLRQIGAELVMKLLLGDPALLPKIQKVVPPTMMWQALAKGVSVDSSPDHAERPVSQPVSQPANVGDYVHHTRTVDLQRVVFRRMLGKLGFVR